MYASAGFAIAAGLVVLRVLGPTDAGRYAVVIGTVDFVATVLWLSSDEALVKYGFRYAAREDWGRFHRLVRRSFGFEVLASLLAALTVVAIAPFLGAVYGAAEGLRTPLLIAAALPGLQAMETIGAAMLVLRGRYDLRGGLLAFAAALRLAGLAAGAPHGVTAAVLGVLSAQVVTSATVLVFAAAALRRFPSAEQMPLGRDRGPIVRFVLQSSLYTGFVAVRTWIAPLVLGGVRTVTDVGLFRAAQAPQQGFSVLVSPVKLILLTDQTRDWEHGRPEAVLSGLRRYVAGASLLMAVVLAPALWAMPWLIRFVLGDDYAPATDAARLVLLAAAIYLVLAWAKSFPVTIGRPGLRLVAHGVETAVLLPLIVVFGHEWGVTGAGGAVLASGVAFALTWAALLARLRRGGLRRAAPVSARE